jgi:hypothetical protein
VATSLKHPDLSTDHDSICLSSSRSLICDQLGDLANGNGLSLVTIAKVSKIIRAGKEDFVSDQTA